VAPPFRSTSTEAQEQCLDRLRRAEALALTGRTVTGFPGASWSSFAAAISDVQFPEQPAVHLLRRHAAWLIVWCQLFVVRISLRHWADHPVIHRMRVYAECATAEWRRLLERVYAYPWANQPAVQRVLAFLGADQTEADEPSERTDGLFRPEALAHAGRGETIGSVLLTTPLPFVVFAWIAGAIMMIMFVFVATVTVPRSQDLRGYLDVSGGVISMLGASGGTLERLNVKPGQTVSIGDDLFHVAQSGTGDAAAGSQKVELQYLQARRDLIDRTRRQNQAIARREIVQLAAKVAVKQDQIEVLNAQYQNLVKTTEIMKVQENRLRKLKAKKYASGTKLDEAVVAYHQAMNNTLASKKEIADATASIEELNHQIGKQRAQIDMEELVARKKLLELDSQINKLTNRQVNVVKATADGIVTTVNVKNGQAIAADTEVLRILPREGTLFASFPARSDAIGLVEEGQAVQLRFDAFPYQKYGSLRGTVRSVTSTAISMDGRSFVPKEQESASGPVFLIEVALENDFVVIAGEKRALMPEMTVTGSVVLERRTILEWFLEPLMAARGRLEL